VSDPQLSSLLLRADEGLETLTAEETLRVAGLTLSGILTTQGAYRQWQLGVLPEEEWSFVLAGICSDMMSPSTRAIWEEVKDFYVASFVQIGDAMRWRSCRVMGCPRSVTLASSGRLRSLLYRAAC